MPLLLGNRALKYNEYNFLFIWISMLVRAIFRWTNEVQTVTLLATELRSIFIAPFIKYEK